MLPGKLPGIYFATGFEIIGEIVVTGYGFSQGSNLLRIQMSGGAPSPVQLLQLSVVGDMTAVQPYLADQVLQIMVNATSIVGNNHVTTAEVTKRIAERNVKI